MTTPPARQSLGPSARPRALATAAALIAVLCAIAPLTGCIVGSHKAVRVEGRQIDQQVLAQITPDQTTETQLLDMLGTPSRSMPADAGGTIFVWDYRRVEGSRGHVFLLFGGSNSRVDEQSVSALVNNGLVRRVWQN